MNIMIVGVICIAIVAGYAFNQFTINQSTKLRTTLCRRMGYLTWWELSNRQWVAPEYVIKEFQDILLAPKTGAKYALHEMNLKDVTVAVLAMHAECGIDINKEIVREMVESVAKRFNTLSVVFLSYHNEFPHPVFHQMMADQYKSESK